MFDFRFRIRCKYESGLLPPIDLLSPDAERARLCKTESKFRKCWPSWLPYKGKIFYCHSNSFLIKTVKDCQLDRLRSKNPFHLILADAQCSKAEMPADAHHLFNRSPMPRAGRKTISWTVFISGEMNPGTIRRSGLDGPSDKISSKWSHETGIRLNICKQTGVTCATACW